MSLSDLHTKVDRLESLIMSLLNDRSVYLLRSDAVPIMDKQSKPLTPSKTVTKASQVQVQSGAKSPKSPPSRRSSLSSEVSTSKHDTLSELNKLGSPRSNKRQTTQKPSTSSTPSTPPRNNIGSRSKVSSLSSLDSPRSVLESYVYPNELSRVKSPKSPKFYDGVWKTKEEENRFIHDNF